MHPIPVDCRESSPSEQDRSLRPRKPSARSTASVRDTAHRDRHHEQTTAHLHLPRDDAEVHDHHAVVVGKRLGEEAPPAIEIAEPDLWSVWRTYAVHAGGGVREYARQSRRRAKDERVTFEVHEHHVAVFRRRLEWERRELVLGELVAITNVCAGRVLLSVNLQICMCTSLSCLVQHYLHACWRCDAGPPRDRILGTCARCTSACPGWS